MKARFDINTEINKLRLILNKKIAENIKSDEVLKLSRELDILLVFYYRTAT